MKFFYIGRFPPPYGGVTIKNKILYDNLLKHIDIQIIELSLVKGKNFREIVILLFSLLNPNNILIIGSASTSRKFFSWFLYYFNRKALNRSLLIVMGGSSSRIIANDSQYSKWVGEFKQVYVETNGMKGDLTAKGLKNVTVFPNCREKPKENIEVLNKNYKKIRCLYFSLISKDKGADLVIEASKYLNKRGIEFTIDFYGHIEDKYKTQFEKEIEELKDINYCGIFRADQESVYTKMQEYDILLFPTKCKTEGVPGVLVESKFAALPSIVSNLSYNSEIVEDGKTGLVLQKNTSKELANAIEKVYLNRDWLLTMKRNTKISSDLYLIDNYVEGIVKVLRG